MVRSQPRRPREDYGFFGPGSPSWKVWASLTALIGFQRSVVLEHFDPFLTAAVADMGGIYTDPRARLDGTLAYFLTVATADGRAAIEAAEVLMRVHAKATGIEPITGQRYSANNPDSQLWIHITGWHSVLKCYECYGPGPLTAEEGRRYWAECAIAAELQTCKPYDVPRSRDEVREYFAAVRPRLCTSDRAIKAMHYLLHTPFAGKWGRVNLWAGSRLLAPAAIATLPTWMRQEGGFDQSPVIDRAIVPTARAVMRAGNSRPAIHGVLAAVHPILPNTSDVFRQHLRAEPPLRAETIAPTRARELYGEAARQRAEALMGG